MTPAVRRAFAFALAALLAPLAGGQAEPPPGVADCTAPIEECLPDLIPTNPRRTSVTDERFPSTLCTDFVNIGRAPVATSFRVLLTLDGIDTSDRVFTGQYQQGQGERDVCWPDLRIAAGMHEIRITMDPGATVPESNESNNVRSARFFVAPPPQADLRILSFDVLPRQAGERDSQVFGVTVVNAGTKVSEVSTVDISDTNGPLASLRLVPIEPGAEATVAHVTRPALRPSGTFLARAVVDALGNNSELDEANNDAYVEYTILDHPMPDLVIQSVEVSGSRMEFRGLLVNVTVENVGNRSARGVMVRSFNESDQAMGQGDSRAIVGPGQTTLVQLRLVLRAGDRALRLAVDPLNEVFEGNETNNDHPLDVTILSPEDVVEEPNLIVERVFAMPQDPKPGEIVSVGALVRNVGTNRSAPTQLNFSIDGRPMGSTLIPSLGVDLTHTGYVPWYGSLEGLHAVTAIADGPGKVSELEEGDNALTLEVLVSTRRPEVEGEAEEGPAPPTVPPPPVVAPPPANATPPTNATRPPAPGPRIVFGDLLLEPRPVPGGVKGVVSVTLRNPNLEPVGLVTVQFKVDGKQQKEVLVTGIPGAATRPATSGEIDLPGGKHTVTAEVRLVGSTEPPIIREKEYDVAAGEKGGIPAPPALLVAVLAAAIALVRRRTRPS